MNGGALHQLVAEVLRQSPGQTLTAQQIATKLVEMAPNRFTRKEHSLGGRLPLIEQLTREVYAQRPTIISKHKDISVDVSRRPLRFFVVTEATGSPSSAESLPKSAQDQEEGIESVAEEQTEHALYQPLQSFLSQEMQIFSKRIRESASRNRRGRHGNKWLHPDIVGMQVPGMDWTDLVKRCANALPARKAKLVSVEVKLRLNGSNVRESFFQTVSNSLWANQAFLAAVEVVGESTWSELRTLCALHGIGFLSIDSDTFSESRVLIPPRERDEIDWASADRIAEENSDFREYLTNVLNYLHTGEVVSRIWDQGSLAR